MSTTLVVVTTEHTAASLDVLLTPSWRREFVVMHDLSTLSEVLSERDGPFFICLMFWHGNASLPVWFDGERYHAFEELVAPVRTQRARGKRVYAYLHSCENGRHHDLVTAFDACVAFTTTVSCVHPRDIIASIVHLRATATTAVEMDAFYKERETLTRASLGVWMREEMPVELKQYTGATRSGPADHGRC